MEDVIEKTTKTINYVEKDLLTSITLKDPTFEELGNKLAKFRLACQDLIFLDVRLANEKVVETRLRDAHGKVNSRFRKALAIFRDGEGKKKHVERRKSEKLYLDFIKSSQRFYRGYIQRLACHFDGIPEVEDIVGRFKLDILSVTERVLCDSDLSRYRETELQSNRRNWVPAYGYYDLARLIDPSSGMPLNQMAVIALADQDHLQATYYLCRALCVSNPAPTAQGNLDIELKKVLKHHRDGSLSHPDSLSTRLLLLHAHCFSQARNTAASGQAEAVLSQLQKELETNSSEYIVDKLCLINIAMRWLARKRSTENTRYEEAHTSLLRFNIDTFLVLLVSCQEELRSKLSERENEGTYAAGNVNMLSLPTRRLLPQLRVYSGWLLTNFGELNAAMIPTDQQLVLKLWRCYAAVMNAFVATFKITEIPEIDYVLPEDLEITGFLPITESVRNRRAAGKIQRATPPSTTSMDGIDQEVLYRIRDLIRDALFLVTNKDNTAEARPPLAYSAGRFSYLGPDDPSECPSPGTGRAPVMPNSNITALASNSAKSNPTIPPGAHEIAQPTNRATLQAVQLDGARLSPKSYTLHGMNDAQDHIRQTQPPTNPSLPFQQQQSGYPPFPTIWNTAFTPRPGETPNSSPRQHTAVRLTPPFAPLRQPNINVGALHHKTVHQNRDIQMRTSPPRQSYDPSSMSYHETPAPSAIQSSFREGPQSLSPWQSSPTVRSSLKNGLEVPRQLPQAALFGAIGEARPGQTHVPTNGQGG